MDDLGIMKCGDELRRVVRPSALDLVTALEAEQRKRGIVSGLTDNRKAIIPTGGTVAEDYSSLVTSNPL